MGFDAGPRGGDAQLSDEPSAAARCGFLVDGAAADLLDLALPTRVAGLVGRVSSAAGGAPSHRMIASKHGRSCLFSSAVNSASIPHACTIVAQSIRPFRSGGGFRLMIKLSR